VLSKSYVPKNGLIEIDVTTIPKGVFLLKMTTSKEIVNYKIIRQ
jgi:hypothetical protein